MLTLSSHRPSAFRRERALVMLAVLVAGAAAPRLATAQRATPAAADSSPAGRTAECLGFSFGTWDPALNWRGAGHQTEIGGMRLPGEFAARDSGVGENEIILFPSWWPAGVGVRFERPPRALGDTVPGVAYAFVADGRLRVPHTTVRAWLKPCAARR